MGKREDIVIVALSRYADSCPPDRHSDCPFAVLESGKRGCNDECRAIVTDHVKVAQHKFAGFDAMQFKLVDETAHPEPCARWSFVSLVTVVKEAVQSPPFTSEGRLDLKRLVDGTSALAALQRLDWDPLALLSYGFGGYIADLIEVVIRVSEQVDIFSDPSTVALLQTWKELHQAANTKSSFSTLVRRWIEASDGDAVLRWDAESAAQFMLSSTQTGGSGPVEDQKRDEYQWAVDRLTETYLHDWADLSLKLEYARIYDGWAPQHIRSDHVISTRSVLPDQLLQELAGRWVRPREEKPSVIGALTARAKEAINAGRYDIAVAVFESAQRMSPRSGALANNLGFCLLQESPAEALKKFEEARRLGYGDDHVLAANAALAHTLLHEYPQVLAVASRSYGAEAKPPAILWKFEQPMRWILVEQDCNEYLSTLAAYAQARVNGESHP